MKKILLPLLILACTAAAAWSQEITWMNYANDQERIIFQKLIDRFEHEHQGVKIKFVSVTQAEFGFKINAAFSANEPPDIFYVGPESVRAYVDKKRLLDLEPYVTNARGVDFSDLYENALKKYRYDGTTLGQGDVWALPKDLGPFAFGYNADLFKKAGIPLPDNDKPYTFAEFLDVCRKLTKDTDGDGKADQWGTSLDVNWSFIQFVWGNGADFLDDSKKKVTITNPKFIEALQFFADLTVKYKVTPSPEESGELSSYSRWCSGTLGFFPVAPWDLAAFANLPFDFDIIPWPVGRDGNKPATWLGSVGYGVSSRTKYPELAAEFALYLSANKETMETMCDLDMQVPNLKSLANRYISKPGKPENRKEFIEIISDYGRSWPAEYSYTASWYSRFFMNIQPVLDGKVSAESYCKNIEPKMQRLLDRASKKQKS
jgi:multiple sugar transport system substrate-binding protein